MERAVLFHPFQENSDSDLTNIGSFARNAMDHIVKDGIDAGQKYTGFPVASSGPLELIVGSGRYYKNGEIYYADIEGGTRLNFADLLPTVTKKIITVAVWGQPQETAIEPRAFLTNVETGQMEAKPIATESRRVANLNLVPGQENANPLAPALQTDVIAVAHVTLTPAGVEEIKMVEENQLSSVQKNLARIIKSEMWQAKAGSQIDTLKTDLIGFATRLHGTARQREVAEVQADVARVKDRLMMSDGLSSYSADHFLALDQSSTDVNHPDHLAKVEEGIRFSDAQARLANIELYNALDVGVMKTGNFALPAYDPSLRLAMEGRDGELMINSYPQQTVEFEQKTRTRRRIRYGQPYTVCTNSAWWRSGNYDPRSGIFRRGNEAFNVLGVDTARPPHGGWDHWMRIQQFWEDAVEEAYWDAIVEKQVISGSIIGQTWACAQDGWLTHIDLFFTQVGGAGDVQVMLCETTNGAPDLKKVIARSSIAQTDLKTWPLETKVPIGPAYVTKGMRYAVVLTTPGAHVVSYIQGNKYAQGTLFYFADGGDFAVADTLKDLGMNIYMAEFRNTRQEVQIQPFELENGIVEIDILSQSFVPQGCELVWQVQVDGRWRSLNASDLGALNGRPPLLNARVVFVGTTDLMPSLTFGNASTVTTSRSRTDFSHISTTRTMPAPVDSVEVLLRLEGWDANRHTNACALLIGDNYQTPVAPSQVEEHPTQDPNAIERRYFFDVDDITSYKIRIKGTTDNPQVTYHVAERVDRARKTL